MNRNPKDKKVKNSEKTSFQYTVKKINQKKVRLSQLREELAHFNGIENKILEKRKETKD